MTGDTMLVDDEPVPFVAGQTVAAALIASGRLAWRATRIGGRPRGAFCGIGACFDCLATVDVVPGQRTCLVLAAAGMQVRTDTPPSPEPAQEGRR